MLRAARVIRRLCDWYIGIRERKAWLAQPKDGRYCSNDPYCDRCGYLCDRCGRPY